MDCDECARGEHGVAHIKASGSVVCACCMTVIAAYIVVDDRPRGERYSLLEALRQGRPNLYPAFAYEKGE